jgi:hypothetical protein
MTSLRFLSARMPARRGFLRLALALRILRSPFHEGGSLHGALSRMAECSRSKQRRRISGFGKKRLSISAPDKQLASAKCLIG